MLLVRSDHVRDDSARWQCDLALDGDNAIAFKYDGKVSLRLRNNKREQRTRRMFPTFPEALSKPEFEQLMWRLSPAKAESWREFWTICEALQAMKQVEYPRPLWFPKSIHRVLPLSVEERTSYWRKLRPRLT